MAIEYEVLGKFKPFLLGFCNCGCGKKTKIVDNKIKHYIKGHRGKNNNIEIKIRRNKIGDYYILHIPNYFSSNNSGGVYEHIYIYQEYHKCCMLPWGVVHHINGIKKICPIENVLYVEIMKHIELKMDI
jgi:hypothetical protein